MDYTEISNSIRMMMKAQGVDEKYIDKEETLYLNIGRLLFLCKADVNRVDSAFCLDSDSCFNVYHTD